jgi:hypothetical protein
MKALLELPEPHVLVMYYLLKHIPPKKYTWVLTGSAGLRLQGVDIPVNDLDLQTDKESIYVLENELSENMKVAVHSWESKHTLSLHGQAEINGIIVELLGDMKHRQPGGIWESPVDIVSTRIWVIWRENEIPVYPLEIEVQAYEKMGRIEKANLIREAIRS